MVKKTGRGDGSSHSTPQTPAESAQKPQPTAPSKRRNRTNRRTLERQQRLGASTDQTATSGARTEDVARKLFTCLDSLDSSGSSTPQGSLFSTASSSSILTRNEPASLVDSVPAQPPSTISSSSSLDPSENSASSEQNAPVETRSLFRRFADWTTGIAGGIAGGIAEKIPERAKNPEHLCEEEKARIAQILGDDQLNQVITTLIVPKLKETPKDLSPEDAAKEPAFNTSTKVGGAAGTILAGGAALVLGGPLLWALTGAVVGGGAAKFTKYASTDYVEKVEESYIFTVLSNLVVQAERAGALSPPLPSIPQSSSSTSSSDVSEPSTPELDNTAKFVNWLIDQVQPQLTDVIGKVQQISRTYNQKIDATSDLAERAALMNAYKNEIEQVCRPLTQHIFNLAFPDGITFKFNLLGYTFDPIDMYVRSKVNSMLSNWIGQLCFQVNPELRYQIADRVSVLGGEELLAYIDHLFLPVQGPENLEDRTKLHSKDNRGQLPAVEWLKNQLETKVAGNQPSPLNVFGGAKDLSEQETLQLRLFVDQQIHNILSRYREPGLAGLFTELSENFQLFSCHAIELILIKAATLNEGRSVDGIKGLAAVLIPYLLERTNAVQAVNGQQLLERYFAYKQEIDRLKTVLSEKIDEHMQGKDPAIWNEDLLKTTFKEDYARIEQCEKAFKNEANKVLLPLLDELINLIGLNDLSQTNLPTFVKSKGPALFRNFASGLVFDMYKDHILEKSASQYENGLLAQHVSKKLFAKASEVKQSLVTSKKEMGQILMSHLLEQPNGLTNDAKEQLKNAYIEFEHARHEGDFNPADIQRKEADLNSLMTAVLLPLADQLIDFAGLNNLAESDLPTHLKGKSSGKIHEIITASIVEMYKKHVRSQLLVEHIDDDALVHSEISSIQDQDPLPSPDLTLHALSDLFEIIEEVFNPHAIIDKKRAAIKSWSGDDRLANLLDVQVEQNFSSNQKMIVEQFSKTIPGLSTVLESKKTQDYLKSTLKAVLLTLFDNLNRDEDDFEINAEQLEDSNRWVPLDEDIDVDNIEQLAEGVPAPLDLEQSVVMVDAEQSVVVESEEIALSIRPESILLKVLFSRYGEQLRTIIPALRQASAIENESEREAAKKAILLPIAKELSKDALKPSLKDFGFKTEDLNSYSDTIADYAIVPLLDFALEKVMFSYDRDALRRQFSTLPMGEKILKLVDEQIVDLRSKQPIEWAKILRKQANAEDQDPSNPTSESTRFMMLILADVLSDPEHPAFKVVFDLVQYNAEPLLYHLAAALVGNGLKSVAESKMPLNNLQQVSLSILSSVLNSADEFNKVHTEAIEKRFNELRERKDIATGQPMTLEQIKAYKGQDGAFTELFIPLKKIILKKLNLENLKDLPMSPLIKTGVEKFINEHLLDTITSYYVDAVLIANYDIEKTIESDLAFIKSNTLGDPINFEASVDYISDAALPAIESVIAGFALEPDEDVKKAAEAKPVLPADAPPQELAGPPHPLVHLMRTNKVQVKKLIQATLTRVFANGLKSIQNSGKQESLEGLTLPLKIVSHLLDVSGEVIDQVRLNVAEVENKNLPDGTERKLAFIAANTMPDSPEKQEALKRAALLPDGSERQAALRKAVRPLSEKLLSICLPDGEKDLPINDTLKVLYPGAPLWLFNKAKKEWLPDLIIEQGMTSFLKMKLAEPLENVTDAKKAEIDDLDSMIESVLQMIITKTPDWLTDEENLDEFAPAVQALIRGFGVNLEGQIDHKELTKIKSFMIKSAKPLFLHMASSFENNGTPIGENSESVKKALAAISLHVLRSYGSFMKAHGAAFRARISECEEKKIPLENDPEVRNLFMPFIDQLIKSSGLEAVDTIELPPLMTNHLVVNFLVKSVLFKHLVKAAADMSTNSSDRAQSRSDLAKVVFKQKSTKDPSLVNEIVEKIQGLDHEPTEQEAARIILAQGGTAKEVQLIEQFFGFLAKQIVNQADDQLKAFAGLDPESKITDGPEAKKSIDQRAANNADPRDTEWKEILGSKVEDSLTKIILAIAQNNQDGLPLADGMQPGQLMIGNFIAKMLTIFHAHYSEIEALNSNTSIKEADKKEQIKKIYLQMSQELLKTAAPTNLDYPPKSLLPVPTKLQGVLWGIIEEDLIPGFFAGLFDNGTALQSMILSLREDLEQLTGSSVMGESSRVLGIWASNLFPNMFRFEQDDISKKLLAVLVEFLKEKKIDQNAPDVLNYLNENKGQITQLFNDNLRALGMASNTIDSIGATQNPALAATWDQSANLVELTSLTFFKGIVTHFRKREGVDVDEEKINKMVKSDDIDAEVIRLRDEAKKTGLEFAEEKIRDQAVENVKAKAKDTLRKWTKDEYMFNLAKSFLEVVRDHTTALGEARTEYKKRAIFNLDTKKTLTYLLNAGQLHPAMPQDEKGRDAFVLIENNQKKIRSLRKQMHRSIFKSKASLQNKIDALNHEINQAKAVLKEHQVAHFYKPFSVKLLEIMGWDSPEKLPLPAPLQEMAFNQLKDNVAPTLFSSMFGKIMEPENINSLIVAAIESAQEESLVINKKMGIENNYLNNRANRAAPNPVQDANKSKSSTDKSEDSGNLSHELEMDKACGEIVYNMLTSVPGSISRVVLNFESVLRKDSAIKEAFQREVGRRIREKLSTDQFSLIKMMEDGLEKGIPKLAPHGGTWEVEGDKKVFRATKLEKGSDGEIEAIAKRRFGFPETKEEKDRLDQLNFIQGQAAKAGLRRKLAKHAVGGIRTKIINSIEGKWKDIQSKMDSWFKDRGPRMFKIKEFLDIATRFMFFTLIGTVVKFLILKPADFVIFSALQAHIWYKAKDLIRISEQSMHQNMLFHFCDLLITKSALAEPEKTENEPDKVNPTPFGQAIVAALRDGVENVDESLVEDSLAIDETQEIAERFFSKTPPLEKKESQVRQRSNSA